MRIRVVGYIGRDSGVRPHPLGLEQSGPTQNSQNNFENEEPVEGITVSYFEAMVSKTVWYWYKERHTELTVQK